MPLAYGKDCAVSHLDKQHARINTTRCESLAYELTRECSPSWSLLPHVRRSVLREEYFSADRSPQKYVIVRNEIVFCEPWNQVRIHLNCESIAGRASALHWPRWQRTQVTHTQKRHRTHHTRRNERLLTHQWHVRATVKHSDPAVQTPRDIIHRCQYRHWVSIDGNPDVVDLRTPRITRGASYQSISSKARVVSPTQFAFRATERSRNRIS
jgi:hypothetical protein